MTKLARTLERLGLTDAKAAAAIGCSEVTVCLARHGRRALSLELALRFEAALGIKAENLPMRDKARRALAQLRAHGLRSHGARNGSESLGPDIVSRAAPGIRT